MMIGLAAISNWTAELSNGSRKMPVMGIPDANDAHHVAMAHPNFWFLCDWIGNQWFRMSIGDILLFIGMGLVVGSIGKDITTRLLSRKQAE